MPIFGNDPDFWNSDFDENLAFWYRNMVWQNFLRSEKRTHDFLFWKRPSSDFGVSKSGKWDPSQKIAFYYLILLGKNHVFLDSASVHNHTITLRFFVFVVWLFLNYRVCAHSKFPKKSVSYVPLKDGGSTNCRGLQNCFFQDTFLKARALNREIVS